MLLMWFVALLLWACHVNGQQDDGECVCVPYYLCKNGTIITGGEGIIDIRVKPPECPSYMDICCVKDRVTADDSQLRHPTVVTKVQCGQRNPDGTGYRITGDLNNEAQFGEFPWMVAILRKETNGSNLLQCGASLIHPQVILTAAHCVQGSQSSQIKIRVGEWDTQTEKEIFPHEERGVKSMTIHSQFNKGNLHNDIALLFLESPLNTTLHISPTCLPPRNFVASGGGCFATGWGKENFGKKDRYQAILKKIELPIMNRVSCQNAFRGTRLGRYFELHESFICAGGERGKDACMGDGGGPLVCPIDGDEDDRYYQVGIVSWGIGCGEDGVPGAYVDVAYFRSWIDQQLKKKNLEKDSYEYQ